MTNVINIGIVLVLVGIPLVLLKGRWLVLDRDFIPLLIYCQFVIYLHVAPIAALFTYRSELSKNYSVLMCDAAALFELPFWFFYLAFVRTRSGRTCLNQNQKGVKFSVTLACLYTGIIAVAFLAIVEKDSLLFMWNGNEENTRIIRGLPVLDWWIFRGYQQSALLIGLTWLLFLSNGFFKIPSIVGIIASMGPWLMWSMLNTRSNIIIAAVFVAALLVRGRLSLKILSKLWLTGVIAGYLILVVLNARTMFGASGHLGPQVLYTIQKNRPTGNEEPHPLISRVNGIDAMALLKDGIDRDGISWGGAWAAPLEFAFLQPLARITGADIRAYDQGTTKVILLKKYAGVNVVDYSSCMLTDVYGNLGVFGFLPASFVLSFACATAATLYSNTNVMKITLGVFIFFNLFSFEQDFVELAYGWLRSIVFIIPFWLVLFRKARIEPKAHRSVYPL